MPPTNASCLEWLNSGATTDGTYPIEVGGMALTVYCDMTTDGGGWTQLLDQDIANGYESKATWASGVDTDMPNSGHYSILNLIAEFEGTSPGFEFFIDWPADGGGFVRWSQSQNPFIGRGTVTNVVESPANQRGCTAFGGLGFGVGGATLKGSTNVCWWWAIGTTREWGSIGIPAYFTSDAGFLAATRARLWVR